jgi:hypothetical protein
VLLDVHRKQGGATARVRLLTAAAIISELSLFKGEGFASVVCVVALAEG